VAGFAYSTWIFDCDGVLLDSNKLKSEAIFEAVEHFGDGLAAEMVKIHKRNAGRPRRESFEQFFFAVLGQENCADEVDRLMTRYSELVADRLGNCPQAPELEPLLRYLSERSALYVVSGGEQDEVRTAIENHGLDRYFSGIYGAPFPKMQILAEKLADGTFQPPCLFVGDSRYDYEVAAQNGIDFIFVHGWSDFHGWREFFAGRDVEIFTNLSELSRRIG
jgi:phosphoglycolate phosphatase-like HAD superfamily hydrolase